MTGTGTNTRVLQNKHFLVMAHQCIKCSMLPSAVSSVVDVIAL